MRGRGGSTTSQQGVSKSSANSQCIRDTIRYVRRQSPAVRFFAESRRATPRRKWSIELPCKGKKGRGSAISRNRYVRSAARVAVVV